MIKQQIRDKLRNCIDTKIDPLRGERRETFGFLYSDNKTIKLVGNVEKLEKHQNRIQKTWAESANLQVNNR